MVALVLFTVVATALLCAVYHRLAQRWQIYDIPNARSAHDLPIPRGGGVAIYLGLLSGALLCGAILGVWSGEFWALLLLSALLVLLGIWDDLRGLPVALRLVAYALTCLLAVWLLLDTLPWWLQLLAAFYALWLLNLFNFMDGIDAIAATEAAFVCLVAAALSLWWSGPSQYALFCVLLAAACIGFLQWNWPPAQLFMGDAGSISIGFLLAMLSLLGEFEQALPLPCWLILLAVFITDASGTLCWRIAKGQRFTEAHSLHVYQRLSRHWGQHRRVVVAVAAFNLMWLAPLALIALIWEGWRWAWVAVAYLPLLVIFLKANNYR